MPPLSPLSSSLPSPASLALRVLAVGFAVSCLFGIHGILTYAENAADVSTYIVVGFLALAVLSAPPFAFILAPIGTLKRLLSGGTPAEQLPVHDVVRCLRIPVFIFFLTLVQFMIALAAIPVVRIWLPNMELSAVDFLGVGASFGLICATTQFYVLNNIVRTRIAPILLSHGTLAHLGDRALLRVSYHMLLLALTLGIAWPTLLYLLVLNADRTSLLGTALMVGVALLLFAFQLTSALRTVSFGVGHIVERMREVQTGDLSTRAEIRGLDTIGAMASSFNAMVEGLVQREHLKETFGRYVTQQVADEILAGRIALGGELRTATVLFSDIRDFTKMSEQLSPVDVVSFLNEYLGAMVDCVLEHNGVLDKFIGDAVMAVFGAPLSQGTARDAENAVACALAMGRRLHEINQRRQERGQPPIRIGIGLHTGELVAGNIGSPRRMEYTVIGDTVNTCSRLEHLTKEYGQRMLLSAATAALVRSRFATREVGVVPIRGRAEPLAIHVLIDDAADHAPASFTVPMDAA